MERKVRRAYIIGWPCTVGNSIRISMSKSLWPDIKLYVAHFLNVLKLPCQTTYMSSIERQIDLIDELSWLAGDRRSGHAGRPGDVRDVA